MGSRRLILLIVPLAHPRRVEFLQWLHRQDGAWVHVPLTPAHNRVMAFLEAVEAGVAPFTGDLDLREPVEDAVVDLLNSLVDLHHDLFVVLDGYGVIENPVIHDAMGLMLDYLPPQVHLVIVADAEPPLRNLPRLRVRRQMIRITLCSRSST